MSDSYILYKTVTFRSYESFSFFHYLSIFSFKFKNTLLRGSPEETDLYMLYIQVPRQYYKSKHFPVLQTEKNEKLSWNSRAFCTGSAVKYLNEPHQLFHKWYSMSIYHQPDKRGMGVLSTHSRNHKSPLPARHRWCSYQRSPHHSSQFPYFCNLVKHFNL